jgi:hypothetical protein
MRWENLVTAAVAVLGGLGISVWLTYLDYRRRLPEGRRSRLSGSRGRLLDTGLGLVALGLVLHRITGAEKGWGAIACYLPTLAGIALVAAHMTRLLSSASDDDGGRPREK